MAYRLGTKTAPSWIVVLDAAEAWGIPPWIIANGKPIIWFIRFAINRREKIRADEERNNKLKGTDWDG